MILFFGMQLITFGYGAAYFVHSIKKKRNAQAIATAAILLVQLAAAGMLLWTFRTTP